MKAAGSRITFYALVSTICLQLGELPFPSPDNSATNTAYASKRRTYWSVVFHHQRPASDDSYHRALDRRPRYHPRQILGTLALSCTARHTLPPPPYPGRGWEPLRGAAYLPGT